ncbi:transient receptor potential-gamma protein-like [Amphiura filiformis]|uniref:transient receptor potential-gamma protein-like n=1 Tax=Amphiura filiformis TaxID=82378 RepID=UPI003B2257F2
MSSVHKSAENQKVFFDAIRRGDVEAVRAMLLADDLLEYDPWSSSPDINAANESNETALSIAIKAKDLEMVSLLLKCGANVRRGLLTAVETEHEPMVRMILEHLKEKETTLQTTVDAFEEDKDYLTPTTPLMYAARHKYHDIVKLLVEYGAVIPDLEEVLNSTKREKYKDANACLHWHQAVTSEAYLVYATDDPIQAAIDAAKLLQNHQQTLLEHRKTEYQEIMNNLDQFLATYVGMATDGEEIEDLIWKDVPGGTKKAGGKGVLPRRVRDALELDFKEFVSGQTCSHFVREQWYGTWRGLSQTSFLLWTLFVLVAQPIICLIYILLPFHSKRGLVKTPYVRFLLHCVSKLYFISFLLYLNISWVFVVATDFLKYCQLKFWFTGAPLIGFYIFYTWLFGMTWKTVKDMITGGFCRFWSNALNWTDSLQLILYWISIALFWFSYRFQNSPEILDAWDRYIRHLSDGTIDCRHMKDTGVVLETSVLEDNYTTGPPIGYNSPRDKNFTVSNLINDDLNPLILSEVFFAIATILSFLTIFRELVINFFVGPLRVSLGGMITDIIRFAIIFMFVWISFAMGMRQLYQSYNIVTALHCNNPDGCEMAPFAGLISTMEALFWSIFNPIDTSQLHVNEDLVIIGIIGEILYAIYMVVVVVVMLNALIAMMADTYERIAENRETEWKVERTKLMAYYMHKTTTLPPPFNVIPTVNTIIKVLSWPWRRNRSKTEVDQIEEVEMRTTLDRQNKNYETFIKRISDRYASLHFETKDSDDLTQTLEIQQLKSEVALLKEALQGIQSELLKNQQILQTMASSHKGESKRKTWTLKKK